MKRNYLLASGALLFMMGCENVETSITILGAIAPDDEMVCDFQSDTEKHWQVYIMDVALQDTFALFLQVRNDLQAQTINLNTDDHMDNFTLPNDVTPTRMDIRWECDSNGFSDELGSLYVPAFSTQDPFCLDEDTRNFSG